jgi:hypothetical protein
VPIVFIHGITVRLDRFHRLLGSVKRGFVDSGCHLEVSGCYWGDLGRSESYTGMSIPGFGEGVRGVGHTRSLADTSALSMLLLEDPLAELTDLRDTEDFTLDPAGFRPVPPNVEARNARLSAAEESVSAQVLPKGGEFGGPEAPWSAEHIGRLVHEVFDAAARADQMLDVSDLITPMSRALTAGICRSVTVADDWPTDFRWNDTAMTIEDILDQQLGGERGKVIRSLRDQALTSALRHGLRVRVMPGLSLFLGDVMAWFRNRDAILELVEEAVVRAGTADPVVLIGHSLGGIIAFEYCVQASRDIELLATVGSQVGFFGELGVLNLASRLPDGKLPVPVRLGRWYNYYDPDDALSFLAAPVFDRVADIEIDTRAPFPIAHSEYWHLRDTYEKLTAVVSAR